MTTSRSQPVTAHPASAAATDTQCDLEQDIAEALTDSLGPEWTCADGARVVMELLRQREPPAAPASGNWATYLAHEIEWVHALDRARLKRRPGRGRWDVKAAAHAEFDPLAATCLADLIERRALAKNDTTDRQPNPREAP